MNTIKKIRIDIFYIDQLRKRSRIVTQARHHVHTLVICQIAVTSMGPIECAVGEQPRTGAASVFTSLFQYTDLINDTIENTEHAVKMRVINRAHKQYQYETITSFLMFLILFFL